MEVLLDNTLNSISQLIRKDTSLREYQIMIEEIGKPFGNVVYNLMDRLSEVSGLPSGALLLIVLMLIGSPLGLIQRYLIPKGFLNNLYSLTLGLTFCFLCFQWFTLHSIIPALLVYFIMLIAPGSKFSCLFSFLFCFSYLLIVHIYQMYHSEINSINPDWSVLQMLMTLKIISVPLNVRDGYRLKKKINGSDDRMLKEHEMLAIDNIPNILDYFGYLFYYPTVLAGPVFNIKEYLVYTYNDNTKDENGKEPPFVFEAFKRFLFFLLCTILFNITAIYYNRANLLAPLIYNMSVPEILFHSWLSIFERRIKYYTAWYLSEMAAIVAGFGYDKTTKRWEKVEQADFIGVEFCTTPKELTNRWNIGVSKWLRYYVYTRVGGSRLVNLIVTFTVSALWHGVYPGYYTLWVFMAIISSVHTKLHKILRPLLFKKSPENLWNDNLFIAVPYKILAYMTNGLCVSYFVVGFNTLTLHDTWNWYKNLYFVGHLALFMVILVLQFVKVPPTNREKKLH
ncbi:hypothetical protein ABK040_008772 [Willaertia magna]